MKESRCDTMLARRSTHIFRNAVCLMSTDVKTTSVTPPPQPTRFENPDGPKLGALRSSKIFLEEGKTIWWCTCGLSKNQPFCDGSHEGTKFAPLEFTPTESRIYSLCNCKYAIKMPFCDGEHKKFPGYVKPVKPIKIDQ